MVKIILSDQGTEFVNKTVEGMLAITGIERRVTSAYNLRRPMRKYSFHLPKFFKASRQTNSTTTTETNKKTNLKIFTKEALR